MTAVFGWMDQDDAQRAAMNELVKMFQDQGSVDELGIGPIRRAPTNSILSLVRHSLKEPRADRGTAGRVIALLSVPCGSITP